MNIEVGPQTIALKRDLQETGQSGFCVDLDEVASKTVFWGMGELLNKFGHSSGLSAEEMIAKYHFIQLVEEWRNKPEIENWINYHRNSNKTQEELPLVEGANTTLQIIHQTIEPVAAYITARPETIRTGTLNWLRKHGFPEAPVIMQTVEGQHFSYNHEWKAAVIGYLSPEVTGMIDDNTGFINFLPDNYAGNIFLFGGAVSPRQDLNVFECADWAAVHKRMVTLKDQH